MDARDKAILLLVIAILSVPLTVVSHWITEPFSLSTPGDFIARNFVAQDLNLWGGGNYLLVSIAVDAMCWTGILSGACWMVWKLRCN